MAAMVDPLVRAQQRLAEQAVRKTEQDARIEQQEKLIDELSSPDFEFGVMLLGSVANALVTVYVANKKVKPELAAWISLGVLLAQAIILCAVKMVYKLYKDYSRRRVAAGP